MPTQVEMLLSAASAFGGLATKILAHLDTLGTETRAQFIAEMDQAFQKVGNAQSQQDHYEAIQAIQNLFSRRISG